MSAAGQQRLPSEARSLAAWGVLELSDATLNELAVRLGRDASTLSSAVKRFDRRCYNEPELKEKIEQLKREIEVASRSAGQTGGAAFVFRADQAGWRQNPDLFA
ncbi:MAG: hypothetical protein KAT62_02910 [Desulfuromonadales bacterium]|nr:hypothetical protein [Desulfuromonadales bacterium]